MLPKGSVVFTSPFDSHGYFGFTHVELDCCPSPEAPTWFKFEQHLLLIEPHLEMKITGYYCLFIHSKEKYTMQWLELNREVIIPPKPWVPMKRILRTLDGRLKPFALNRMDNAEYIMKEYADETIENMGYLLATALVELPKDTRVGVQFLLL